MNRIKLTTKDKKHKSKKSYNNHFIVLKFIIIKKFTLAVSLAHPKIQYLIF